MSGQDTGQTSLLNDRKMLFSLQSKEEKSGHNMWKALRNLLRFRETAEKGVCFVFCFVFQIEFSPYCTD